ncbi:hypothetical protein GGI59_006339 [Rhizobium lentis]|uniref:Uncharacterized protein n=1 Tax=Rhizobium lentis TaxID=1138194 RepID=A0A7W9CYN4_9HYPH|nr:hypothetical protein [Rhizobium lentis]MBB4577440.1 hypothetical protein [Rhizobium lentis]MBB5554011.1 hypothetical protein [Rhizobium lentis]MBB5564630.1 hypothetical protein [Rhizobium lentis]MBB5571124.1 hypothetical protein [Rhizobium lentis]
MAFSAGGHQLLEELAPRGEFRFHQIMTIEIEEIERHHDRFPR